MPQGPPDRLGDEFLQNLAQPVGKALALAEFAGLWLGCGSNVPGCTSACTRVFQCASETMCAVPYCPLSPEGRVGCPTESVCNQVYPGAPNFTQCDSFCEALPSTQQAHLQQCVTGAPGCSFALACLQ